MFDKVCSFENLHLAYLKARQCKRYRDYVLEFSYNLEENLLRLQQELLTQTYQHGSYREFVVCDSKKRRIKAAPFRDRVIHHALCNIIEPIFDRKFIYDSYACRKEKGTHRAIRRLERFIRSALTGVFFTKPRIMLRGEKQGKRDDIKYIAFNAIFQSILTASIIKYF